MIRGYFYRAIMRIAHRYNWHYAPPIYPENDVQLWCKWCGFRQTIKHGEPSIPGGPCQDAGRNHENAEAIE